MRGVWVFHSDQRIFHLNRIIGSIIKPTTPEEEARGFVGYSKNLFRENFKPDFQPDKFGDQSFMTVFAVFFPSLCGILAGTSITGDLRDPSGAIPKGTMRNVLRILLSQICVVTVWLIFAPTTLILCRHTSACRCPLLSPRNQFVT